MSKPGTLVGISTARFNTENRLFFMQCSYVFHVTVTINSCGFPTHQSSIGLSSGSTLLAMRGVNGIFIYNID
jgi:hypothetical protein